MAGRRTAQRIELVELPRFKTAYELKVDTDNEFIAVWRETTIAKNPVAIRCKAEAEDYIRRMSAIEWIPAIFIIQDRNAFRSGTIAEAGIEFRRRYIGRNPETGEWRYENWETAPEKRSGYTINTQLLKYDKTPLPPLPETLPFRTYNNSGKIEECYFPYTERTWNAFLLLSDQLKALNGILSGLSLLPDLSELERMTSYGFPLRDMLPFPDMSVVCGDATLWDATAAYATGTKVFWKGVLYLAFYPSVGLEPGKMSDEITNGIPAPVWTSLSDYLRYFGAPGSAFIGPRYPMFPHSKEVSTVEVSPGARFESIKLNGCMRIRLYSSEEDFDFDKDRALGVRPAGFSPFVEVANLDVGKPAVFPLNSVQFPTGKIYAFIERLGNEDGDFSAILSTEKPPASAPLPPDRDEIAPFGNVMFSPVFAPEENP
jgi:hypothetical protein